ncbi:MAG: glycosyltransferase family 9 protein [Pseudohongiella sp.]|nr:glycosyltransferase family 9 protein [Pseudohongiella sp.]
MTPMQSEARQAAMSTARSATRIVLVNPTKFLGNLLLSGGLIQQLCQWCTRHDKRLLLVLDEGFKDLVDGVFPGAELVFYPRKALLPGAPVVAGVKAWWRCVAAIRRFRADLAFTIEEDSVCHRLTHFSGARYKVSSTSHRYHFGFDLVLDIARSGRSAHEASIWFSIRDVFRALGIPAEGEPAYLVLPSRPPAEALLQRLDSSGVVSEKPLLLIHAGASKPYKQWPPQQFAELIGIAARRGYQVCLVGAGGADQRINREVLAALMSAAVGSGQRVDLVTGIACTDLCNQLSLTELASLMSVSARMLGNDSGPSHLASALGVPGVVIFGPTDVDIWRPLAANTVVLEKKLLCGSTCSRHHCPLAYRCLSEISATEVAGRLAL